MEKKKGYLIFFVCLFLIGCAIVPLTKEEIDPGPYPDNYEALIKQYLREALFDPDSMKDFSIDAPSVKTSFNMNLTAKPHILNLRKGQGLYDIRHFYITYALANGAGILELAERVGHVDGHHDHQSLCAPGRRIENKTGIRDP